MLDLKPEIRVMTREQIQKVHNDALSILEKTGVVVDDQGARHLFEKAIGNRHEDHSLSRS